VLRRAARHADWIEAAAGTRLQRQGIRPSWLWVTVDGPLELRRDGLLVGMVPEGAAYGEAELLLGVPAPDDLVAPAPTTVVSFPARAFHGLLGDADFATAVARRQAYAVGASPLAGNVSPR
jgi:CRP-like cAMP-binding protein